MNSWEIIKEQFTRDSTPKTLGRSIAVNQAAELFVRLMPNLTDREAATELMNKDEEVRNALVHRRGIEELREAGVIG